MRRTSISWGAICGALLTALVAAACDQSSLPPPSNSGAIPFTDRFTGTLLPWLRFTVRPADAAERVAQSGVPVCYVLAAQRAPDDRVLQRACAQAGLPRPRKLLFPGSGSRLQSLLVRADSGITNLAGTAGKKIGVQAGTTGKSSGASVGPQSGKQLAAGYVKGMAVFTHIKGGLMYEASVAGQKFTFKPVK